MATLRFLTTTVMALVRVICLHVPSRFLKRVFLTSRISAEHETILGAEDDEYCDPIEGELHPDDLDGQRLLLGQPSPIAAVPTITVQV